jgi:WD40 repeat protein
MNKLFITLCFVLCLFSSEGQTVVGGEEVPIKIINYSENGNFVGRTHLNPYEIKVINKDSTAGFNIGTENGDVKCFSFSPSTDSVVIGTYLGFIELWNIKEGRRLFCLRAHDDQINDIKFLNSDFVVSCGRDGTINKTSLANKVVSTLRSQKAIINSIEVIHGSSLQLVFADHLGNIGVINTDTGELLRSKRGHAGIVFDLVWDKKNNRIFSAGYDGQIKIWELPSLNLDFDLTNRSKAIFSIDYNPKINCIVSGGMDKRIDLWDLSTKKLIKSFDGHKDYVFVVRFTPDQNIISGSRDLTFRIWKL